MHRVRSSTGFSLIELVVATGLLLVVSSIVTTALMQMTNSQKTIWNRTEMHSGIRGATELLQQEVGQAGRISLPAAVTLATVAAGSVTTVPASPSSCVVASPQVTSVAGMWADKSAGEHNGIKLTLLDGNDTETVRVTALSTSPPAITACFWRNHNSTVAGQPVTIKALGGFAEGIVPPSPDYSITIGGVTTTGTYNNGSDKTHLKLVGDVNSDDSLSYVEYVCDQTTTHTLSRNWMQYTDATKAPITNSKILLTNVYPNTNDSDGSERPCFKYQWVTINNPSEPADSHTYVLDVAITLTVQTEQLDPITRTYQTETKALLNVSPRNVFNTWSLAGLSFWDRIQATPWTIKDKLLCATAPCT